MDRHVFLDTIGPGFVFGYNDNLLGFGHCLFKYNLEPEYVHR